MIHPAYRFEKINIIITLPIKIENNKNIYLLQLIT